MKFEEVVDALCNLDHFELFATYIAAPNQELKNALLLAQSGDIVLKPDVADAYVYELISEAETSPEAFDSLSYAIAARLMTEGSEITKPMRFWLTGVLLKKISRPRSKGGPNRLVGGTKRIFVANLVFEAVKLGLKPTRSVASSPVSACDAVVAALERFGYHISFDAVAKSWTTHAQHWMRDELD